MRRWASSTSAGPTVGSSNIDPFSLLLAREANLVVRDAAFAKAVRDRVEHAIEHESVPVHAEHRSKNGWTTRLIHAMSYAVLRFGVSLTGITGRY